MTAQNRKHDKIDQILDTIDAGLQSTTEASYGETPWDGANVGDPTCIRCARDLDPDTGEICSACRAYLLGDTSDDPAGSGPHELDAVAFQMARANGAVGTSLEEFAARVDEIGRALAEQTSARALVLETPPGVSVDVGDAIIVEGMPYRVEDVGTDGFSATPIAEHVDKLHAVAAEFAHAVEELGRALADALRPIAEIVLALLEQALARFRLDHPNRGNRSSNSALMPGELAVEGDAIRADVERRIAAGELLREPDGYYSTPIILGTDYTRTGRMEVLGYWPTSA